MKLETAREIKIQIDKLVASKKPLWKQIDLSGKVHNHPIVTMFNEWVTECGMSHEMAMKAQIAYCETTIGDDYFSALNWMKDELNRIQSEINSLPSIPRKVYLQLLKK